MWREGGGGGRAGGAAAPRPGECNHAPAGPPCSAPCWRPAARTQQALLTKLHARRGVQVDELQSVPRQGPRRHRRPALRPQKAQRAQGLRRQPRPLAAHAAVQVDHRGLVPPHERIQVLGRDVAVHARRLRRGGRGSAASGEGPRRRRADRGMAGGRHAGMNWCAVHFFCKHVPPTLRRPTQARSFGRPPSSSSGCDPGCLPSSTPSTVGPVNRLHTLSWPRTWPAMAASQPGAPGPGARRGLDSARCGAVARSQSRTSCCTGV